MNADNYSIKLEREGLKTRIILLASNLHAVTVGSYTTRQEAQLSLSNLRARHPEVWILEQ